MENTNITTASILKAARKRAGLTQLQLAQKLGITATSVRRYESGAREPGLTLLEQIADIVNCPLQTLLGGHMPTRDIILCLLSTKENNQPQQEVFVLTVPESVTDNQIAVEMDKYHDLDNAHTFLKTLCCNNPGWTFHTDIPVIYATIKPNTERKTLR